MKKTLLLAGFVGMVAANAEAIDATPYVGLDASYGLTDYAKIEDTDGLSSKNLSLSGIVGARTDHFGLEAFYNAGNKEHKAEDVSSRISSYGVDALAFQQLGCSGRWELVGSAGLGYTKLKGFGDGETGTDHGLTERLGAGVQYALTENTTVRAMYRHSWVNDSILDEMDELTVGIRYAF